MQNSWPVQSQSNPSITYTVMKTADGRLLCNCPGHSYNGTCKHTSMVEEPTEKRPKPNAHPADGKVQRQGIHQQTVVREDKDGTLVDDVLAGKVSRGVARPTDQVVDLADQPIIVESVAGPGEMVQPEQTKVSMEEIQQRAIDSINSASDHYLVWEGPWAVCQTCEYRHSVPLDFSKYDLVNGKPVKKPLAK